MGISPETDEAVCRALFEHADGFLCVMDRELNFVWVNRVRPELTMAEVVGQPLASFLTSETFDEARRCALLVWETGAPASFAAHNSIGGKDVWTEGRVGPIPGRDDIVVLTTRNITKERQAEASLREVENTSRGLIEAFPGIMLVIEPGGTIIAASRDAASLLDVPNYHFFGWNLFERAADDGSPPRWALAERVAETLAPVHATEEYRGRVYDTIAYPILNQEGKLKQIAIVAKDITEQREAERELQARAERERHSDKMQALGTLAAGIAHDFNNLLTPILLNGQRVGDPSLDPSTRAVMVESIVASAQRGAALVKQILAYGRSDNVDRKPVELRGLIRELEKLVRGTLPSHVKLDVALPEEDVWVDGNPGRIHQALINLCVNAEHAMPDGGTLRVELVTARSGAAAARRPIELADGDYARIRVLDEGCGIAAEDIGRVFEPFYSTKSPDRGSGLGLFVVHGVMTEHGGGVTVESTPGVSSCFELWLPLGSPASAVSSPRERAGAPRALRVLLADDEPRILRAAGDGLQDEGHQVRRFADVQGLEEAFMSDPTGVDVVIMDHRMTDGTGLELARRLRAHRPDLPILLCTGFVTPEVERACGAGGFAVLQKPYGFDQLLSSVLQVVGSPSSPSSAPR